MRIHSKKALRFDHPGGADVAPPIYIRREEFRDVPDWVAQSTMFKLATADNTVTPLDSKRDENIADGSSSDPTLADLKTRAKALGVKGYSTMDKETLTAAIVEAEANPNVGA